MVGIARARGCGTCRKRKIAVRRSLWSFWRETADGNHCQCGLEKPTCAQCNKSKRTCTGYRKYPIFIAHQPPEKTDSATHRDAKSITRASSAESCKRSTSFNSMVRTPSSNGVQSDPITSLVLLRAHIDPNPALRQQLLEVYLDNHLSKNNSLGPMQQRVWLIQIPGLPHLTPALESSMMALCLSKLGDVHNDPTLVHESLKLYQRSLHQLQLALWEPELMLDDQTLTACLALGMYEMSQCPNRTKHGYISHTLGCRRLVQLRGPEAHVDGLGHAIFVHFRIQGASSHAYALSNHELMRP